MLTFQQFNESFDSNPAKWTILKDNEVESRYSFTINNDLYHVMFLPNIRKNKPVGISFGLYDPSKKDFVFTMTNTGNQFKVLSTVMDTINDFIKNWDPSSLKFSARKEVNDRDSKSRSSVYLRLIKKYLSNNWTLSVKDTGFEVIFTIEKKS